MPWNYVSSLFLLELEAWNHVMLFPLGEWLSSLLTDLAYRPLQALLVISCCFFTIFNEILFAIKKKEKKTETYLAVFVCMHLAYLSPLTISCCICLQPSWTDQFSMHHRFKSLLSTITLKQKQYVGTVNYIFYNKSMG